MINPRENELAIKAPLPTQGRKSTDRKTLNSALAHRIQRQHFLIYWLIPHLALFVFLPFIGVPSVMEAVLFLVGWLVTVMGVSVGFHRLFTHKSLQTHPWIEKLFAIAGMMAAGGSLLSWVSIHRRHHEQSDQEGDPHSPLGSPPQQRVTYWAKLTGYLHSHAGWMPKHDFPNPTFYCRDLYAKPHLVSVNKKYQWWVILGLLLPALINGVYEWSWIGALRGIYFGGIVRLVFVIHCISSVNSICHGIGGRNYQTNDRSTNCWWLSLLTGGESWHNNHHALQTSAYFGHKWWEVDLGGWLIWSLSKLGLVWNAHGPSSLKSRFKEG